jgi:hypothetical protein
MRRPFTLALLSAALAFAPAITHAATCGDLTNNGARAINDVASLLTCVANASTCAATCGGAGALDCADLNQDGSVNIADAVILLNDVLGKPNILPICTSVGPTIPCNTVISADITSNQVWGSCTYFLDGMIFVESGVVLTIQPGAVVKGLKISSDSTPSALVFKQGDCSDGNPFSARINANGTPSKPIVFTSDQPAGSRARGDWAGVAFNGCSHVNAAGGTSTAEGLVGVTFGGGATPILNEFSGIARYIRGEFAGRELAPNNELNVWTMNALGSATQFDHIQAHAGNDDGLEWFGGTINTRYMVATANADDNFDWQLGTTGAMQYGLIAQHAPNLDTAGSNGFEGDNNELTHTLAPYSNPKFCNVTVIGSKGQPSHPAGSFVGVFLRRGTSANIGKVIVTNMQEAGLQLRDPTTSKHACVGECIDDDSMVARTDGVDACDPADPFTLGTELAPEQLRVNSALFFDNGSGGTVHALNRAGSGNTGSECNSVEFYDLLDDAGEISNADPGIGVTWPPTDPRPGNAAAVTDSFDCAAAYSETFFDANDYIGAFDPDGANWLETPGGWISFETN